MIKKQTLKPTGTGSAPAVSSMCSIVGTRVALIYVPRYPEDVVGVGEDLDETSGVDP